MKSYALSIICAAIICSVVKALLDEKSTLGKLSKLLSGIFLAVTILSPLINLSFVGIADYLQLVNTNADAYIAWGAEQSQEELSAIIKTQTEAYILDKADRMGLDIAVEVELDGSDDSIPSIVTITGSVSPYARESLGAYIEDTLGIKKENQIWN